MSQDSIFWCVVAIIPLAAVGALHMIGRRTVSGIESALERLFGVRPRLASALRVIGVGKAMHALKVASQWVIVLTAGGFILYFISTIPRTYRDYWRAEWMEDCNTRSNNAACSHRYSLINANEHFLLQARTNPASDWYPALRGHNLTTLSDEEASTFARFWEAHEMKTILARDAFVKGYPETDFRLLQVTYSPPNEWPPEITWIDETGHWQFTPEQTATAVSVQRVVVFDPAGD